MDLKKCFALVLLVTGCYASTLLRIAAGGTGGQDAAGNAWQADQNFNNGAVWTNCGSATTPACPANLTAPFLNLRYAPSFSYTLQVPPGIYNVSLAFIEPNKTAGGQRLFSVSLNGSVALSQFDIFQAAGGALKPITNTFPVVATSGTIQIVLTATLGNAVVSGIQVDTTNMGPPGPLVPIQYDSYVVLCSTQPAQNCSGKFTLTRGPVGRIGVFLRLPGSPGGLLLTPDQYTVGPFDQNGAVSIMITATIPDGSTLTLVYPATGPASAIGNPQ